jgi:hypothetical protein
VRALAPQAGKQPRITILRAVDGYAKLMRACDGLFSKIPPCRFRWSDEIIGLEPITVSECYSIPPRTMSPALLAHFLTLHAVARPRNGFQSFRFDIATAFSTLSEAALPQTLYRLLQCSQGLLSGSRFVDQRLPLILARCLIRGISVLCRVNSRFPLRPGCHSLEFRDSSFQKLPKVFRFLR